MTMPKDITNFTAYMPDINLHLPFDIAGKAEGLKLETVTYKARCELGRELTKKERQQLYIKWTKAVNRYQLVVMDQYSQPIKICGGSVWAYYSGSPARFAGDIYDRFPQLSKKVLGFIKGQWFGLTSDKRGESGAGIMPSWFNSKMDELQQAGTDAFKADILAGIATGKKVYKNMDHLAQFHFSRERGILKAKLKNDSNYNHSDYKIDLQLLKDKRAYVLQEIEKGVNLLRNEHKNSSSIHVTVNAAGYAPEVVGGKRFRVDGYTIEEPEPKEGTQRGISNGKPTKAEKAIECADNGSKLPKHLQSAFTEAGYSINEALEYIRHLHTPKERENPLSMIQSLR